MAIDEKERLRRWRLVLGGEAEGGKGGAGNGEGEGIGISLGGDDLRMDGALEELYDNERSGGLGASSPKVARWLGDIRSYFPSSIVRVMQKDALERLNLTQMLLEPEMLEQVDADVHLVSTLLSLSKVIPEKTKDTARQVVRKVVEEMERKLSNPMLQAVKGSLNRPPRTYRPRPDQITCNPTIPPTPKNY